MSEIPNDPKGSAKWWREHLDHVEARVLMDTDVMVMARAYVTEENISSSARQGHIRSGELGKWDLYYNLQLAGVSERDRLLLTSLTAREVQKEEDQYDPLSSKEDTPFDAEPREFVRAMLNLERQMLQR